MLDLHCNRLRAVEGLCHLTELRVLNLAGNLLGPSLDSSALLGMHALIELNLRRNQLTSVDGLQALPALHPPRPHL